MLAGENIAGIEDMAKLAKISPSEYVSAESIPTVLVCAAKDTLVLPPINEAFRAVLDAKGAKYEYFELPNSGHNLENDGDIQRQSLDALLEMMKVD